MHSECPRYTLGRLCAFSIYLVRQSFDVPSYAGKIPFLSSCAFSKPRSEKLWDPMTDLTMPKAGSDVVPRNA